MKIPDDVISCLNQSTGNITTLTFILILKQTQMLHFIIYKTETVIPLCFEDPSSPARFVLSFLYKINIIFHDLRIFIIPPQVLESDVTTVKGRKIELGLKKLQKHFKWPVKLFEERELHSQITAWSQPIIFPGIWCWYLRLLAWTTISTLSFKYN